MLRLNRFRGVNNSFRSLRTRRYIILRISADIQKRGLPLTASSALSFRRRGIASNEGDWSCKYSSEAIFRELELSALKALVNASTKGGQLGRLQTAVACPLPVATGLDPLSSLRWLVVLYSY